MRFLFLEGHVNDPLLRGAGTGVYMLVGAAYDWRRRLFPGSPQQHLIVTIPFAVIAVLCRRAGGVIKHGSWQGMPL